MDKKKVKELMNLIRKNVGSIKGMREIDDEYQEDALNFIKEVQEELNKSDWVSVEDRQPPKNVVVRVCNKQNPENLILAYRTNQETMKIVYPNNIVMYAITHWKPIEKLEE